MALQNYSKHQKELEILNSESNLDDIKNAINILLKSGGSFEFMKTAEYILSIEPDTRWGIINPYESFIDELYYKAIEELTKPPIEEGQNHIESLDVIHRFFKDDFNIQILINFIKLNNNNEDVYYYSIECLCAILKREDNFLEDLEIFSILNNEIKIAATGIDNASVKPIIALITTKKNEQIIKWILELVNSKKTQFDILYYLFLKVYGYSSIEDLKALLKDKCQQFIDSSWNNHPENYIEISTLQNFFSNYKQ